MENNQQTVDLNLQPQYEFASKGQRLGNYIIDMIVYYAIIFVAFLILGFAGFDTESDAGSTITIVYLIVFSIMILYYTLMEFKLGKTIGKMVTKTKVIREDNTPLTLRNCFLRTLARFVPFEAFSILFGSDSRMWHDQWNDTHVVKDKSF